MPNCHDLIFFLFFRQKGLTSYVILRSYVGYEKEGGLKMAIGLKSKTFTTDILAEEELKVMKEDVELLTMLETG